MPRIAIKECRQFDQCASLCVFQQRAIEAIRSATTEQSALGGLVSCEVDGQSNTALMQAVATVPAGEGVTNAVVYEQTVYCVGSQVQETGMH